MDSEDIGWLKANVQTIIDNQERHEVRLDKIDEQLNLYRFVYRAVKFIGLAVIAVLTFQFGDVTHIWHRIFNA